MAVLRRVEVEVVHRPMIVAAVVVTLQLLPESMRGRFFDALDAKRTKRTEWSDSAFIELLMYNTVLLSASGARDNQ